MEEKKTESSVESVQVLSYYIVNGTTLRYAVNDFNMNFKLGNLGLYFDVGYLPTELNTEKMTMSLKHATKIDPSFQTMEFIESLKFGTP